MTVQPAIGKHNLGKCMLHNWAEERAVAALDTEQTRAQIQKHGHKGILTMDRGSKVETVTTHKAVYNLPKSPGVRLRGIRGQLLEEYFAQMISETVNTERNPPTPRTDFCSITQRDFGAEGFEPQNPETTKPSVHDYKTDQAITFYSENFHQVQGETKKASFRKSAQFSTPIGHRLKELELPLDN